MDKNQQQQLQQVVDLLNDAFRRDPKAMHSLMCNRVPCDERLVDHPTIQVDQIPIKLEPVEYCVGCLGLINGIVETLTEGRVAMLWSEPDLTGQRWLRGFCVYRQPTL
jgi:hypothetical protein